MAKNKDKTNAAPKAIKPSTGQFTTEERADGRTHVVHIKTGTSIKDYEFQSEMAEETKDWANRVGRGTKSAAMGELEKSEGTKKEVLTQIIELTGKNINHSLANQLQPKEKTRETYSSAARQSFQPDNVTAKDKKILEAVEKLRDAGVPPFSQMVADEIGVSVNAVSGAVSVLVAKGIVSTIRTKTDGGVRRIINVLVDWRALTPRPKKQKPVPDPLADDAAKEPEPANA